MINGLDLFSGIGGITYALQEWVRPLLYCEKEPYCQSLLLSRMQKGDLPKAPIWDNITTLRDALFDSGIIYQEIDIIYGGFPCQDISIIRNGEGLEGKQSRLFYEIIPLIEETDPAFIFLENIPAILKRGGSQIVKIITALGYDVRWIIKSCKEEKAPHTRKRWFMLAHTNRKRSCRLFIGKKKKQSKPGSNFEYKKWDVWPKNEPEVCRMDDGIPFRMDRIKALKNSVCPIQVKNAFLELLGVYN